MKNQKGFSLVTGLIIVLIIAVVGYGGFYVLDKNKDGSRSKMLSIDEVPATTESVRINVGVSTSGREFTESTLEQVFNNYAQMLTSAIRKHTLATGELPDITELPDIPEIKVAMNGESNYYPQALSDGSFHIVNGAPELGQYAYIIGFDCSENSNGDVKLSPSFRLKGFVILVKSKTKYICSNT